MAKNFSDLHSADPKTMTRDQAMIYIINFFNSRMATISNANRNKVKELIGIHEIALQELVNKYIDLVLKNSQLPKRQEPRPNCQNGRIFFLQIGIDSADTNGILKETMDGDSHNDIKRGYLKCWSSMAEADIVFPNPSDLASVAVVSESLKVLTRVGR